MGLFEQYGTDAVRYWAASARPGVDTAFSEDQMKVGRKLATKLLNVSKFVLGISGGDGSAVDVSDPVDASMLARLDAVVAEATSAFAAFDYARALERTESFFWWFTDDYVELVKGRAYGSRGDAPATSAKAALTTALSTLQRLFAPFLPFTTEECWRWWQPSSIHTADWPSASGIDGDAALLDPVLEVLARVRRAKTEAKVGQRAAVESLSVTLPDEVAASFDAGRADLADAGSISEIETAEGATLEVSVRLADGE